MGKSMNHSNYHFQDSWEINFILKNNGWITKNYVMIFYELAILSMFIMIIISVFQMMVREVLMMILTRLAIL